MPSSWYQQQLTPNEVTELNIRLGVIPEADHVQVMVELKDPITNILIAQWSIHHDRWSAFEHMLTLAHDHALELLRTHLDPF